MKKMIVWTIAMVFALCTSLAFAAEEKAEKATGPATAGEPKNLSPAPKAEMKHKKKVKKAKHKGTATAGEPTKTPEGQPAQTPRDKKAKGPATAGEPKNLSPAEKK